MAWPAGPNRPGHSPRDRPRCVTAGDLRRDPGLIVASLASRPRITVCWDARLADLGMAAALNAQVGKAPLPMLVQADGVGRFPQDTEAAARE